MPARKATELTDLIKKLRTIRRQHESALDEIESTFRNFGIEHLLESGPSRKRGSAGAAGKAKAKAKTVGKAKTLRTSRAATSKAKGKPAETEKAAA